MPVLALAGLAVPGSALAATGPSLAGSVGDAVNLSGATSVAVAGNYAYSTAYAAGRLTAVDISNPASPFVAGTSAVAVSLQNATNVTISGGFAYVVSKNRNGAQGSNSNDDGTGNSLTILNIANNPSVPAIVGTLSDPVSAFGAYGIAVSGQRVYIAAQGCLSGQPCPNQSVGDSFSVVDVSSPSAPTLMATLRNRSLPGAWAGSNALKHVTSVAISGSYAYVTAAYSNRLTVIDISNPASPAIVASLQDNSQLSFPVDVTVSGHFAYVADQITTGRMAVVDIANPLSPRVVGSLTDPTVNGAYRVRTRGSFVFVSASSSAAITAVDVSNPASPRMVGSLTDSAHLYRTTGLDVVSTGRYVVASSPYLSTEGQILYPPFPFQPGGPTQTGTISMINLDPASSAVFIVGKPANPTTSTTASFTFSANNAVVDMQCKLDAQAFSTCSGQFGQAYSSLSLGTHTFTVQAIDPAGNVAGASYTWTVNGTPPANTSAPPANTSVPVVSGSAVEGSQLSASSGSWSGNPAPSFAYAWQRCDSGGASCAPIPNATGSTHTLLAGDVGSRIVAVVTATNGSGSATASSAATGVVRGTPAVTTSRAALKKLLTPIGFALSIHALLVHHGYQTWFAASQAGRLVVSFDAVGTGGHRHARPVVIAQVVKVFQKAEPRRKITIKLTPAGRRLLAKTKYVRVMARVTFTPRAGSRVSYSRRIGLR